VDRHGEQSERAVRADAMNLFGDVGPAARTAALPIVLKGLTDKSAVVRVAAAHALRRIDRYNTRTFAVLEDALKSKDKESRAEAAKVLLSLGAASRPAVSALVAALKDEDSSVRMSAAATLGDIGPAAKKEAAPALTKLLKDPDAGVRVTACWAGWAVMRDPEPILPVLREIAKEKDEKLRLLALVAFGKMEAAAARPRRKSPSSPATIRQWFAALLSLTLGQLGTAGQAGLSALAKVLQEGDREARADAYRMLVKIDPQGKKVLPLLSFALTERNSDSAALARTRCASWERRRRPCDRAVASFSTLRSAQCVFVSAAMKPSALAARARTAVSSSLRASRSAGTADFAGAPSSRSVFAARSRVSLLRSVRAKDSSGSTFFPCGSIFTSMR